MAQPALAEVRVSCPACGGAIHPIAGRCKHCKADLVTARGGATAAMGSVIQLGSLAAAPSGPAPGLPSGPAAITSGNGLPAVATAAGPPVVLTAAPTPRRPTSWRRRWPLLVAAIAAVAILASLAILLFSGDDKKPHRRRALGPAPERMQTDQLPTDPWQGRGTGAPPNPDQMQPIPGTPPPDIDPGGGAADPDLPPIAPGQINPPPPPPAGGTAGSIGTVDEFVSEAVDAACRRLATCWGGPSAASTCEEIKTLTSQGLAASAGCPQFDATAAKQCVRQLNQIPCPDQGVPLPELLGMVAGLDACMRTCQ